MGKIDGWVTGFVSNPYVLFFGLIFTALPIAIALTRTLIGLARSLNEIVRTNYKSYRFKIMFRDIKKGTRKYRGAFKSKDISNHEILLQTHYNRAYACIYVVSVLFISSIADEIGVQPLDAAYIYSTIFCMTLLLGQVRYFASQMMVSKFSIRSLEKFARRLEVEKGQAKGPE